jgi:hypothetical protein
MDTITGTYQEGRIILDSPVDWPEGSRVGVVPPQAPAPRLGLRESEWPDDARGRAEWLAWYDALEPLELTPQDEAEIAAAREAIRRATLETR